MSESMVPLSHILWSHVWLGVASDAFERARSFVRAAARQ
jgi:acyl-CoA dehydrogenase